MNASRVYQSLDVIVPLVIYQQILNTEFTIVIKIFKKVKCTINFFLPGSIEGGVRDPPVRFREYFQHISLPVAVPLFGWVMMK